MALTHIQIINAKPREKAYKLPDNEALYLVVQPTGAKLWRMNYRYLGQQKTLHFGAWPTVGIAAARDQRDQARKQLAAGLDPAAEIGGVPAPQDGHAVQPPAGTPASDRPRSLPQGGLSRRGFPASEDTEVQSNNTNDPAKSAPPAAA